MQTNLSDIFGCRTRALGLVLVAWLILPLSPSASKEACVKSEERVPNVLPRPLRSLAGPGKRHAGTPEQLMSHRPRPNLGDFASVRPSEFLRNTVPDGSQERTDAPGAVASRLTVRPKPLSQASPSVGTSESTAACVTVAPPAAVNRTDLQEIIDRLPSQGGCVALAPGVYPISGLKITKHLLLMGSGRNTTFLQMDGEGTAVEIRSPLVTIKDLTLNRKPGSKSTINYMIDGEESHQLRLVRVALGGADVAQIRLNQVFNVALESLIVNGLHPRASIGLSLEGNPVASTTVFVTACEFNNFLAAIDIHNTFGVVMDKNIFVGNSDAVRLNSGRGVTFLGNWVESGGVPSTYALHLTSPSVGQVFASITRTSGSPPSSYVRLSGGATPSQMLIFDFSTGPSGMVPDADLKGNLSIPAGAELLFKGDQKAQHLQSDAMPNGASPSLAPTSGDDITQKSAAGPLPLASNALQEPTIGVGRKDGDLWLSRRDDHAGERSIVVGQLGNGGPLVADLRDGLKIGGGSTIGSFLSEEARVSFPSLKGPACAPDAAISVPEAAVGDTVTLATPPEAMLPGVQFFAWISAPGTISLRACTFSGSVPSLHGTFRFDVWKHL